MSETPDGHHHIERLLARTLRSMREHYRNDSEPNVESLLRPLGTHGAAVGGAVLAMPFTVPVSLGPLTAPASLAVFLLAWQLMKGSQSVALPARVRNAGIPERIHKIMSSMAVRLIRLKRRWAKPRLSHLVEGDKGLRICGLGMMIGAVLLAVPVPMLPFTNTFPALGIALFGLGCACRDGLLTVLAAISNTIGFLILSTVGLVVLIAGKEALGALLPGGS